LGVSFDQDQRHIATVENADEVKWNVTLPVRVIRIGLWGRGRGSRKIKTATSAAWESFASKGQV
jgi:hypothetical protein